MPGVMMAATTTSRNIAGMASAASVIRISTASTQPPKYPETAP